MIAKYPHCSQLVSLLAQGQSNTISQLSCLPHSIDVRRGIIYLYRQTSFIFVIFNKLVLKIFGFFCTAFLQRQEIIRHKSDVTFRTFELTRLQIINFNKIKAEKIFRQRLHDHDIKQNSESLG